MRILLLTPQLPYPPDKGTRIRNWGLIKELTRRHEVGVFSFAEPGDAAAREELARHCRVLGLFETPHRGKVGRICRPDLVGQAARAELECATQSLDVHARALGTEQVGDDSGQPFAFGEHGFVHHQAGEHAYARGERREIVTKRTGQLQTVSVRI